MGLAQSRDGMADPDHIAMLRHLSRKASVSIALQQVGEIEAGGTLHGYVEVLVKTPAEVDLINDPRDRYKYSYAEIRHRNEVHFSSISVELLGEVNTRVRHGKQGHGAKARKVTNAKDTGADSDSDDDTHVSWDKANSDGGLISGHVLDSTGMVIRTNLSTKNQTHESVVLYRQTRTVARAVSRDTEHLFQEMNSFTSVADDSIDNGYGDEVLEPGMHRFPFAFTVPEDAQSTCSMIRSYNGDNTACSTARLIVHADIPLGPGDKRRVALQVPVARSNSSSRKSSKKSAKQAAATLTEIASLAVHSVPLHIRSRVPPDPAAQRPAQRLSLETDPRQVNIRHVGSADDLTTPIYDQDGLPSNQVLAPIHSALEDGSDGGGKVERTSSAARDSMSLQPFVVDTRRMSCCCLPCGRSMTLQARTDSYSYCTTDTPKVEWEIITKSHKKVQNVCLELIRKCEWKAQKHDYVSELILSQVTRNCVDQGSKVGGISEFEFGGNLNLCCNVSIPLSDPNSIVCCSSISTSIFSVTYFIRVTARVYPGKGKCCSSNPVVHLPISLYSRLYTEMGLRGSGDEQAQAQGSRAFQRSGSERFLLNSGEAQLMVSATLEYIKLFRMFGGVNYSTHGADNLVPALAVPAIYDVKYGM